MSTLIRRYFDGCNRADVPLMTSCFIPDAVHYFPPGMYGGPFVGAQVIAERWVAAVETFGSTWTVDQILADAATGRAVIEWTHFKTALGEVLRGDEWYVFDRETGLIREIRAYYASPQDSSLRVLELGGFDYAGRGYPTGAPDVPGREMSGL
jgi:methyltransferase